MTYQGLGGRILGLGRTSRGRLLICVCCKLSSQAKFKFSHIFVPVVMAPHGCKYLAYGPKVLLHITFLYGLP